MRKYAIYCVGKLKEAKWRAYSFWNNSIAPRRSSPAKRITADRGSPLPAFAGTSFAGMTLLCRAEKAFFDEPQERRTGLGDEVAADRGIRDTAAQSFGV